MGICLALVKWEELKARICSWVRLGLASKRAADGDILWSSWWGHPVERWLDRLSRHKIKSYLKLLNVLVT